MSVDPDTMHTITTLGPAVGPLVVALVAWLELRLMPLARKAVAGHRAVTRKLGVTDADVAAELAGGAPGG